ncbi:MAG: hypothetical protein EOO06_16555 [Chitinophagaceae bacterium]|nr:MAG: hypothetical protein EOO06_16555 [Chitinophagaceae bacterium]
MEKIYTALCMICHNAILENSVRLKAISIRIFAILLLVMFAFSSSAQINIASGGTISENFNSFTNPSTLPTGWRWSKDAFTLRQINSTWAAASTLAADNTMPTGSCASTNGSYYAFNTVAGSAGTDRCMGFLSSGSATQNGNIFLALNNNGGSAIPSFNITYSAKKFRNGSNTAGFRIAMFYSTNGSTWTSMGSSFNTTFSPDANSNCPVGTSAGTLPSVTNTISSQIYTPASAVGASSVIYFAWNYSVSSGTITSNAQLLGIDDVVITANASGPSLAITGTPTNFGSTCIGSPATTVQYTITNSGAAASGVSVVSNDPQFVVSGLSSTTIAGSGGTATYNVTFTPSAAGPQAATITVSSTTSGSNSPTSSLSGTGVAPVSPSVSTNAATATVNASATLNGTANTFGVCPATTQKGFVYSLTSDNNTPTAGGFGVITSPVTPLGTTGVFSQAITVTPGAGYSYRAYQFDGSAYTYGTVSTFATTALFTSQASGDWNVAATWDLNAVPTNGAAVVIRAADIVYTNTSLNRTASTTINGSFELRSGGYASGTDFNYGVNGTLIFNDGAGVYGVNNTDVFWPATNGPFNVTVNNPGPINPGGIRLNNMTRTVIGAFVVGGTNLAGLNLNSATLFLNGSAQINLNGYFANTPVYGPSSTLIYNTGLPYAVGNEWTGGGNNTVVAGTGVPANVTVQNSTSLQLPAGARGIERNLNVLNASSFNLNGAAGADLYIKGNLTFTGTGSFNGNNKAVFFVNNSIAQVITSGSALTIPYIVFAPPSGSTTVQLNSNLIVSAPANGSTAIAFNNAGDRFLLNGNTLTIGSGGFSSIITGTGSFTGTSSSSLALAGTGSVGTLNFTAGGQMLSSLTLNRTSGAIAAELGTPLTLHGAPGLTLTNGILSIGTNNLSLIATASQTGGSAASFVATDGTGQLLKYFSAAGVNSLNIFQPREASHIPLAITLLQMGRSIVQPQ